MTERKLLVIGGVLGVVLLVGIGTTMTMLSAESPSRHGGVEWESDLDSAIAQASEEGSPVLVYVWFEDCSSCADFETRLQQSGPPSAMHSFVLAEIEADEDRATMDKYNVSATPTLIVLTENGTKVASFNPLAVDDLDDRLETEHDRATSYSSQ